jgi:GntR family transcriptional regulator
VLIPLCLTTAHLHNKAIDIIFDICYILYRTVVTQRLSLLISIKDDDPRPIYSQIVSEIKEQIRVGTLSPGDELPSVRELADSLGINLHTAHKAYQVLREQGVIHLRLGRRAKVAQVRTMPAGREDIDDLEDRVNDLITEAFHLGLSKAQFLKLVEGLLTATGDKERGK